MEKFVYYSLLFDIYKSLFSSKINEIFKLYYEENLSMGEIAESLNVSRSYIGSSIKKTEKKLEEYETTFHIFEKNQILSKLLECSNIEIIKKEIKKIIL